MRNSLLLLAVLGCAGCATTGGAIGESEPVVVAEEPESRDEPADALEREPEVPLAVAESEQHEAPPTESALAEVVVAGRRSERQDEIHDRVIEAQSLLRNVKLDYVFTGRGRGELLRGRPVAFALWSEVRKEWTVAHLEIPRPPVRWRPGGRPMRFIVRTPGLRVQHVKGTGAERLMFSFSRSGEPLRVYGRKFPVFDNALLRRKQWRAAVETAKPIVYLPFTDDTLDPGFVHDGRAYLLSVAHAASDELRRAGVPSSAFPGELLAEVIPVELITTLAVIEQTDDSDFREKGASALDEVLSQYGLKRQEAYRYSVSSAAALGPMQFTNRRGNGTYALVVRRCAGAGIDPDFERGATNLGNAMKAAICLLDLELAQMRADLRFAYRADPAVLGIFPVAAYNGGPRNVVKLYRALASMRVRPEDLRRRGESPPGRSASCPCVWREDATGIHPVPIPRYNNENRWYIEKYQSTLGLFEQAALHAPDHRNQRTGDRSGGVGEQEHDHAGQL